MKIKNLNLFLSFQLTLIFLFYFFTKRSLNLDAAHNLIRMIAEESFYFLEIARQSIYFLQQIPSYLTIKYTSFSSLNFLIFVWSLGLVWIPIISLLGSFFILPKHKKEFVFFPLLFFFTGFLTALGISVSASLSVSCYLWFAIWTIYYSDLSQFHHRFLFLIIPIFLLLSHEMMSYMGPVLIFFCCLKLKEKSESPTPSLLIHFVIIYLIFCCLMAWFFIFFPVKSEALNRTEFFYTLLRLGFLLSWEDNQELILYPSTLVAGFLLALPFLQFVKNPLLKNFKTLFQFGLFLSGFLCVLTPFNTVLPFFKVSDEEVLRVWVCCFALPLSLLIWYLYEKQKLKLDKSFLKRALFVSLTLSVWRLGSDYQFYQVQKKIVKNLEQEKGIVPYNKDLEKAFSNLSGSPFHIVSYSLLFQKKPKAIFSLLPENNIDIQKKQSINPEIPTDLRNCDFKKHQDSILINSEKLNSSCFSHLEAIQNTNSCYFGKKLYSMCSFFNLEKLNSSRFFNLEKLIQNIKESP